jgi:hypothetical protein
MYVTRNIVRISEIRKFVRYIIKELAFLRYCVKISQIFCLEIFEAVFLYSMSYRKGQHATKIYSKLENSRPVLYNLSRAAHNGFY